MTTPILGKNGKSKNPYAKLTRTQFEKELPEINNLGLSQKKVDDLFYKWQYERSTLTAAQFKKKYSKER